MKVVLINAPYLDIYGSLNVGRNFNFPLGIGYIASYLIQSGHEVLIFEPEIYNFGRKEIKNYLKDKNPDLVGISCATPNFFGAVKIAQLIKEEIGVPVVLGGVHASSLPEQILREYSCFDFVVVGEGEETMKELIDSIKNNSVNFENIKGLFSRQGDSIINGGIRPFIENLDSLPFPARELIDLSNYRPQVHLDRGKKSATMITSRGCPGRCTFCASFKTLGYRFRAHSAGYVLNEIDFLIKNYGIEHFIFVDDTFTIDRKRVIDICNGILNRNYKIDWYCFARVNTVDEELLMIMKKAGCFSLLFGIESGNQQILNNIKKGITLEQSYKASMLANRLGFKVISGFIFGNPGETEKTINETINFAKKLNPIIASFNRLIPFPGTEVYEEYYKDIYSAGNDWKNFIPKGVVPLVKLDDLSVDSIQKYSRRAYLQFYLRPSQIWRMLRSIKTWGEFKAYLRGGYGLLRRMLQWKKKEVAI